MWAPILAILTPIAKWVVLTVLVPIIEKAVAGWIATQKKIADFKKSKTEAVKKGEEYEKNPTDDSRDSLP